MARAIRVEIIGDSRGFESALARSSAATRGFASELGKMAKVAAFAAGAAAIGGLAIAIDESVKAAIKGQASAARLEAGLKAVGISAEKAKGSIEANEKAGRALGFTNIQVRQSMGSLVVSTGSLSKTHRELAIAEDLARLKGVDLTTATKALTMANAGSMRPIKQLGITVDKVTSSVDALKASHEKLTTEQGRADLAAAKIADRNATVAKVMDVVSGKVKGQGQAFAQTAAGQMQVFKANLDALFESLGNKLLPALTRVVVWINQNWPEISKVAGAVANAIGVAVKAMAAVIGAVVDYIRSHWAQISAVFDQVKSVVVSGAQYMANEVRTHWTQISEAATSAFNDVKAIISGVIGVVKAIWSEFGSSLTAIAKSTWNTIKTVIGAEINVIKGIINVFAGILKGDWGRAWQGVKQITSGLINGVVAIIKGAVGNALTAAIAVGQAILSGITDILKTIGGKVKGALDALWGVITHVASLAYNAATAIGAEIIHGIVSGIEHAAGSIASTLIGAAGHGLSSVQHFLHIGSPSRLFHDQVGIPIMQGIADGITAGISGVESALSAVGVAMERQMVVEMQKAVAAAKVALQKATQGLGSAISSFGSAATSGFDAAHSGYVPPSQKKLNEMQKQDAIDQANKAIQAAQSQLQKDTSGGADQATIDADKQAIADAQRQLLETQLSQQAQAEQEAHDAKVKTDKDNFEKALAELEKQAGSAKTKAQVQAIQGKIRALFKEYGITPGTVQAGADWNAAQTLFVAGMGGLKKAMDALVLAIEKLTAAQDKATEAGVGVGPFQGSHAAGGVVKPVPGGVYRVAEAGHPEAIIPLDPARRSRARELMSAVSRIVGFDDGGIPSYKAGAINPTTGLPDDPAYRASAMYLNDYGIDRNQVDIGTALAGLLGPGAQAKAAMRHTYVHTPSGSVELRQGSWRAAGGVVNSSMLDYWRKIFPGVTFEPGTPGQQISWMQAASRLPMGGQELGSLIASSLGGSGTGANTHGSLVEQLTSHAVHFERGGIALGNGLAMLHKNEAVIPLGARGMPIQVHSTILLDGRVVGKSVQDYLGEQDRFGGPTYVRRQT